MLRKLTAILATACLVACGGGNDEDVNVGKVQSRLIAAPTLNTYINDSVEIDQVNQGSLNAEDANLFVGDDPADGTASVAGPAGPGSFLDWNDLDVTKHVLVDVDGDKGKDPSSFPKSNECVAPSKVLSKMDLRYVAAANNNKYAYFAVLRSDNNGDAGYYWLFTKAQPKMVLAGGPCSNAEEQLLYDLEPGDVLLGGHFKPNESPLLTVYRATKSLADVPAGEAINFESDMWEEVNGVVKAVAVNTTPTAPGAFGTSGAKAVTGGNLGPELFAEAAVDLSAFTGTGSHCGATYYGSVITRPSGAGGTSPDLKDLAGPALFNFGSTSATATLQGSCVGQLTFSAQGTGPDGSPLENATCSWEFSNGMTSDSCSGTVPASPGDVTGKVTITDSFSGCSDVAQTLDVRVDEPLSVSLTRSSEVPVCSGDAVTYTAVVDGGNGNAELSWNGVDCTGSSCEINPDDSLMCTDVSLSVTVTDPTGACVPATSETETYSKVTTVTATDN